MTPEQEEQVARALAETARHEPVPPLPDEVASRLDDVLADLVAARGAQGADRSDTADEGSGASVAELATHRRRRRPQLLTAAAAVALVVAAGAAIATGGLGSTSSPDESASSAAGGDGVPEEQRPDAAGEAAKGAGPAPSTTRAAAPRLRTSSLAADVRRLLVSDRSAGARDLPGPRRKALTGPPLTAGGCAVPSTGPGEVVLAVRLDGQRATLLLGPVRGDTRSAEVYSCGDSASPAASATVPLP